MANLRHLRNLRITFRKVNGVECHPPSRYFRDNRRRSKIDTAAARGVAVVQYSLWKFSPMNVLIIGNGGREHALAWKISKSPRVERVFVAPGNAGTALDAENVDISPTDFPRLIKFAQQNDVQLTVVGPELPLTKGIVDAFGEARLRVFGPRAEISRKWLFLY